MLIRCSTNISNNLVTHSGTVNEARGGTTFYKPYRYVPPHRVGFFRCFGPKTGIHFDHFGLELGMTFEETTECMNVFIVSIRQMSKERKRNVRIRKGFENFFSFAL